MYKQCSVCALLLMSNRLSNGEIQQSVLCTKKKIKLNVGKELKEITLTQKLFF